MIEFARERKATDESRGFRVVRQGDGGALRGRTVWGFRARSRWRLSGWPAGSPARAPARGDGLADFWRQLVAGENAVIKGPPGSVIGRDTKLKHNIGVSAEALRYGAYIRDIDQFDAEFFRISPVEAQLLDPQQRLMLETSWLALEEAGIAPEGLRDNLDIRTGVYAGISLMDYREATIEFADTPEAAAGLFAVTGLDLEHRHRAGFPTPSDWKARRWR